jgi:hypothetical protein
MRKRDFKICQHGALSADEIAEVKPTGRLIPKEKCSM